MVMTEDHRAVFYDKVRQTIDKYDRMVVGVMVDPPFAYSIGNSLKGIPEMLLIGFDQVNAAQIINAVSDRWVADEPYPPLISLGGTYPLMVVVAGKKARDEYTIQAGQYLGNEDYPVVQLLAPDKTGLYPGDPGCDPAYNVHVLADQGG